MVTVSIIIVNWNSVGFLKVCLDSIERHCKGVSKEIIVVDNASYDGCKQLLDTEFKDVRFIQSSENLGFAKANNLGCTHASGTYLLFLNPDTELTYDALTPLLGILNTDSTIGAVGGRLLYRDGTLQLSSVLPYPTILNELLDWEALKKVFHSCKLFGIKALYSRSGRPELVDALSGACICIRHDVFTAINGFSTDYFMYMEDIDLCYKVHRHGFHVVHVPDVHLMHYSGGATKERQEKKFGLVAMIHARFIYFEKYRGAQYAQLYRLSTCLIALIRLVLLLKLAFFFRVFHKQKKNNLSNPIKKWYWILRWCIGLEKWAADLHAFRYQK